jgi:deazaflavin-dependent oxidoreductase (nitroreductase family)
MITPGEKWRLKVERPFVIFFYRLLSRWAGGFHILLLTTTGRKSQRSRTVPLVYLPIEDSVVVVAANLGSDDHPGWYLNLKQDSHAQIQIGSKKMAVVAEALSDDKREQLWAEWIKLNPGYQGFQARTARILPLIILKPAKPL